MKQKELSGIDVGLLEYFNNNTNAASRNKDSIIYAFGRIIKREYSDSDMMGVVLTQEIVNVMKYLLDMDNKEDAAYFKNVVSSRVILWIK